MREIKYGFIHHSAGAMQPFDHVIGGIDDNHSKRLHNGKWGRTGVNSLGYSIAYHYLLDLNGDYIKTREERDIGYHAGIWTSNAKSVAICLLGNFSKHNPTKAMLNRLRILVLDISARHNLTRDQWKFHKDVKATQCPGLNLVKKEVLDFVFNDKLVSEWAMKSVTKAKARKIATKWENPREIIGNVTLAYILRNLGLINKVDQVGVTKEQFIVAMERGKIL